jgi:membrane protein involved in colicin uptake
MGIETADLKKEIAVIIQGSEFLSVSTRPEYDCVTTQINIAAGFKKQIEEFMKPKIDAAYKTHKLLTAERADLLKPVEKFITDAKEVCNTFLAEQQRRAEEAARKVQAELDRQAAEATKKEKEAEAARRAAEAAGDRKAAQAAAEAARKAQEEAQAAEEAAMVPVVPVKVDAGDNMVLTEIWDFEVLDRAKVPEEYKVLDSKKVRAVVEALKDSAKIPGLRIFKRQELRRKGGRGGGY